MFYASIAVAIALAGAPVNAQEQVAEPSLPEGVAGELHVVIGDKESSDMAQRLDVAIGDNIQLSYVYAVRGVPTSVTGTSEDDQLVMFEEARSVRSPIGAVQPSFGTGTVAGYFVAEKVGETTITFTVDDGQEGTGLGGMVVCGVTVHESR